MNHVTSPDPLDESPEAPKSETIKIGTPKKIGTPSSPTRGAPMNSKRRLSAKFLTRFPEIWQTVTTARAQAFLILDGKVETITGRVRRETDEVLNGGDSSVWARHSKLKNTQEPDPFGDEIWKGMVEAVAMEKGAIPEGLGETGKEIAIVRAERLILKNSPIPEGFGEVAQAIVEVRQERIKIEKAVKKAAAAKKEKRNGAEIEAERARVRSEKKALRAEGGGAEKGKKSIAAHAVILREAQRKPETKRVYDFLFSKDDPSPEQKPTTEDASAFIAMLERCAMEIIFTYAVRNPFQNPAIRSIGETKVRTLLAFPDLPDPEIRNFLAAEAAKKARRKEEKEAQKKGD